MHTSTRHRRRGARTVVAGVGLALLLAGCGFNAQTLQPYTPAHGVNVDAGSIKVRNLLLVSDTTGNGIVSASLVSSESDQLTQVTGTPNKADGSPGAPLTVSSAGQITLNPNQLVVLTAPSPAITVSSPDLQPGMTAELSLTFASGTTAEATAPVMSFNDPIYATVTPSPASASATPAGTAVAEGPGTDGLATPAPTATP